MPQPLSLPSSVLLATALASAPLSAQVAFTLIAEIDVANAVSGIGNNVAAVAWNGTDLFVAGFNGSTASQAVAINKLSAALTNPSWGTPFGGQPTTPSNRGYLNLAIDAANGRLVAGYDNGGSDPNGLTCWDLQGNPLWSKNMRGGAGLGFDPGRPGGNPAVGRGVAWGAFGQPGRALQNAATGADIWTTANGMNVLVAGSGTFLRDWDFDPATGDIYIRSSNDVFVGRRTGDNVTVTSVLFDLVDANLVNQQNICFLSTPTGSVVLCNDRATSAGNQAFANVIRAVRTTGVEQVIDWGTFVPNTGAAAYDFSYDRATNTLAISDYFLRKVYLFQVNVQAWHAYGSGCPGQGNFTPQLSGGGSVSSSGGTLVYQLSNAAPLSPAFFAFGFSPTSSPLGNGCNVLIDPVMPFYLGPIVTGPGGPGSGTGAVNFNLPGGYSGSTLTTQAVVLENANPAFLVLSNGVFVLLP